MTVWAFEDCELDTDRYELRRAGAPVAVEPQVFDVLAHLVANRDRVVDKHELLDAVWHTRFVTESTLTSRIKAARRAIGDDGRAQRLIRTVHGRGYRFVADVDDGAGEAIASRPPASPPTGADQQQIAFCTAPDGVRVAYATVGARPGPPLVKAANWLTNLRYDWTSVVWRHWLRDLSAERPLVLYDERGCGMSDWDVDDVSFDARVRDLETVVDAQRAPPHACISRLRCDRRLARDRRADPRAPRPRRPPHPGRAGRAVRRARPRRPPRADQSRQVPGFKTPALARQLRTKFATKSTKVKRTQKAQKSQKIKFVPFVLFIG
jgi:DNA-binding winged helix-turn-helix (wHTH) protein